MTLGSSSFHSTRIDIALHLLSVELTDHTCRVCVVIHCKVFQQLPRFLGWVVLY